MIEDVTLVVNTHENNLDCFKMFWREAERFGLLDLCGERHVWINPIDTFSKNLTNIDADIFFYNEEHNYCKQVFNCLDSVETKYILYCNEDYIPNGKIDISALQDSLVQLECNPRISFARFVYSDVTVNEPYVFHKDFKFIPHYSNNVFSQVMSIWRTDKFRAIHDIDVPYSIGEKGDKVGHFEQFGNKICFDKEICGIVYRNGKENKRGIYHFDPYVIPHIATAIIKGVWNTSEYPELWDLFEKYSVNPLERGILNKSV